MKVAITTKIQHTNKLSRVTKIATIIAARVRHQSVSFTCLMVKETVFNNRTKQEELIDYAVSLFGPGPVALIGEKSKKVKGTRRDVIEFVAKNFRRLPWKEYKVT